jgi:hypothetical protein
MTIGYCLPLSEMASAAGEVDGMTQLCSLQPPSRSKPSNIDSLTR